jgi:hypothetical protein
VAVGGTWPGAPSPATRFPARMLVDWVRVWSLPRAAGVRTAIATRAVAP